MLRSWKLGTAFGIGVYVHSTFLVLILLLSLWNLKDLGLSTPPPEIFLALKESLYTCVLLLGVFTCVVLHEFGHALTARRFGIETRDITLYPIGGVARLERMSEKPWEEFWIAVMGPAVNVVIALVLGSGLLLTGVILPNLLVERTSVPVLVRFPVELLMINIGLIVFNMIPAFPMDGGRVLRALLSAWLGQVRATEIAALAGTFFAMLFVLAGLNLVGDFNNPMLLLIGLFVFLLGQQELAMVRHKARFGEPEPERLQRPVEFFYTVDASAVPAEPNYSGFTWDGRARVWVEWREGRPIHACFTD